MTNQERYNEIEREWEERIYQEAIAEAESRRVTREQRKPPISEIRAESKKENAA